MASLQSPLIIPILNILSSQSGSISEYELLTQLDLQGDFEAGIAEDKAFAEEGDLLLFQQHFLIMHALYQLQAQLFTEGLCLHVSPLNIQIKALDKSHHCELADINESPALKAYYSDLSQLESADENVVEGLLKGFWEKYLALDNRAEAYGKLELAVDADWGQVKIAYRRLAKLHHPDHGGDQGKFIVVRSAYETLSQVLN